MNRFANNALLTVGLAWALASSAQAQATRTWVSGVGDDANPCSRTAPCKTFAGAISKTAAGGEISVLDPGGFGTVTITKSITLNGAGTIAGILASGTNGVVVNAGPSDVVTLRHLSLNGSGTGLNGIRYLAGGQLVVEHCALYGFTQNDIDVSLSGNGDLAVSNTSLTGGATGLRVFSTSGRVQVSMNRVAIQRAGTAVDALFGSVEVTDSVITQNSGFGLLAEGGTISSANNLLAGNGTAVQAQAGSTVRLSNNDIFDNSTGFGCGGGTLATAGNNRKAGNSGGGVACAPNATITLQ
jgi:Right handed beta helix region